jgi:hypothetical protein
MDSFEDDELVYTVELPDHTTFTLDESSIHMSEFLKAIYICDRSYDRYIRLTCTFNSWLIADVFCYISYHVHHKLSFPTIPKPISMIHPSVAPHSPCCSRATGSRCCCWISDTIVKYLKPHVSWFCYAWVAYRSDEELIELYKIASYFLLDPVLDILNACIACKCNCIYITKKIANK